MRNFCEIAHLLYSFDQLSSCTCSATDYQRQIFSVAPFLYSMATLIMVTFVSRFSILALDLSSIFSLQRCFLSLCLFGEVGYFVIAISLQSISVTLEFCYNIILSRKNVVKSLK